VVLPVLAGIFAYFAIKNKELLIFLIAFQLDYYKYIVVLTHSTINYVGLLFILIFLLILVVLVFVYYKYNDFRELMEYMMSLEDEKVIISLALSSYLLFSLIITVLSASDIDVLYAAILTAAAVTFLSRADPKLSRYLFPGLELRLMRVDGSVIALVRGGCLEWAKVRVAPEGRDIVIRGEDCEVVVSPYVEHEKSRPQCDPCKPAYPPLRIIGGERVVVHVVDGEKKCCYYVVDTSS